MDWDNQRSLPVISGTVPLEINMLQRCVTSGAIANAVFLSIRAEISSGPVDLVVSKLESSLADDVIFRA